jgi:hypothetical protein
MTTAPRYVRPTTSRVLASTLGVLPASVLAAAAVARFTPVARPLAFGLAYALWVPLWLAAACWVARARSGSRAWLLALTTTAIFAAGVFAIPH